jgi:hypothetical protein
VDLVVVLVVVLSKRSEIRRASRGWNTLDHLGIYALTMPAAGFATGTSQLSLFRKCGYPYTVPLRDFFCIEVLIGFESCVFHDGIGPGSMCVSLALIFRRGGLGRVSAAEARESRAAVVKSAGAAILLGVLSNKLGLPLDADGLLFYLLCWAEYALLCLSSWILSVLLPFEPPDH